MNISVIGAGAWGTTIANLLSKQGNDVLLWVLEDELCNNLKEQRKNTFFLPDILLSETLQYTQDFKKAAAHGDIIIFGIPLRFLRAVALETKPFLSKQKYFVNISKGIEMDSFKTGSFILKEIFGEPHIYATLSGPNIAKEVVEENFTQSVIAAENIETQKLLKKLFETPCFHVCLNHDILGVELGGALKNVMALAAGLCDGLQYTSNTKAALLSRGLYEMVLIGKTLGANGQTFYGLSGIGDLITSSFSPSARNRITGELLGQGKTLEEILLYMNGKTSEGVYTTEALHEWNKKNKLSLPIAESLYELIYLKKNPIEVFKMMWINQNEENTLKL